MIFCRLMRARRMSWLWLLGMIACLRIAAANPASAKPSGPDRMIASRNFKLGSERFAAGQYEAALEHFRRAALAVPSAELDYNIALCLDVLERHDEAISAYERHLEARPDGPNAASVRARLAALRERKAQAHAAVEPPPPVVESPPIAPPPPPPPIDARREPGVLAPALVGGAAVALALVGSGLLGHVGHETSSRTTGCCSEADVSGLRHEAYAGYAMFAVAGAAAIVDVALWVRWARAHRAKAHAVASAR